MCLAEGPDLAWPLATSLRDLCNHETLPDVSTDLVGGDN